MGNTRSSGAGRRSRGRGPRVSPFFWKCALAASICAAAGAITVWRQPAPRSGLDAAARGERASAANDHESSAQKIETHAYLGPQACRSCHAERVAEFLTTNHARTFRVPEDEAMPAGFAPGHGTI